MNIGIFAGLMVVLSFVLNPDCRGQEVDPETDDNMKEKVEKVSPEKRPGNSARRAVFEAMLSEKSALLAKMSETLGKQHPDVRDLEKQIADLEMKLRQQIEAVDPKVRKSKAALAMERQMQDLSDVLESLRQQIRRIEELEIELHNEVAPSRAEFIESVDKMFSSGNKYFGELENAMVSDHAKLSDQIVQAEVSTAVERELAERGAQFAEFTQARAEEIQDKIAAAYLEAAFNRVSSENVPAEPGSQRMEIFDERLSRIEGMLEKLISGMEDRDK